MDQQLARLEYAGANTRQAVTSTTTCQEFPAPPELVWKALLFYEEITERPPFVLRCLLPRPIGTGGRKFELGGEVECRYVNGRLLKRVTEITHPRIYAFEVIEQNLALAGIKLLGGDYALREFAHGHTQVALTTRYASSRRPRWLFRWIEERVCHVFHRHILTATRNNLSRRDVFGNQ